MSLNIAEEPYLAVQGEGPDLGLRFIILRLAKCNLRCDFCDTKYSWNDGKDFSSINLFDRIESLKAKRVLITGGEPLLQQEGLLRLIQLLNFRKYYVEIETNGTIIPLLQFYNIVNRWIISPKNWYRKALEIEEINWKDQPLKALIWSIKYKSLFFKFVIGSKEELQYLIDLILFNRKAYSKELNFRMDHIMLMPKSTTVEEQQKLLPLLIEASKQYGFRVTPRLQILAYGGNIRGT